ncbi:MAG: trehalose-6-phosphate synthase [Acidobacteria bacterium]|jgi:trehalose 6-phosphate synthase|nr:trehalose-6-phosphate synthase [Acidobacteriota bacterium]MDP7339876.1 trehalose-6-phosphate synthase [Vicinamibacterales bacterium]MDP7693074.1 trehalose-6-phosphate synthase [Vicinamibacterales bacterium]HJN46248.1 trehalose-6-phosphate synthase [Vicinamibacterales bacterium]
MPESDTAHRSSADRAARPLAVVSNREPYLHSLAEDGTVSWSPTTGGVAVALDALMHERGGVWIAHGAGDADRLVVDAHDRVSVPPDAPSYPLRRIWLTEAEEHHYYEGFANEGLWPLCHVAHVKPIFRAEDWRAYQAVNERFARAVEEELPDPAAPVFIQDYHLTLVARHLRALRPDVRIALFWHIPFPHPDQLRICPYRREILEGLVASDLVAFQLERDRRNFLAAARTELGAKVSRSRVYFQNRSTTVYAVPIGVDFDRIQAVTHGPELEAEKERLRRELRIDTPLVGIGVDRLDYTKGIPERLDALDRLFTRRPELRRQLTFVQVAVPSRSKLESYAAVEGDIDQRVAAINARHAGDGLAGGPIRYRKSALRIRRLVALYRLADFCIVSSLHDGMNLVAKEFVAAREDLDGVLVLSEFAGAAQELGDAVIINPYDVGGFADGLEQALDMALEERQRRMRALRRVVAGRDVVQWASDILEGLEHLDPRSMPAPPGSAPRKAPSDTRIVSTSSPTAGR